jgi:large subunit ribosomal protein L7/L12
MATIEEKIKALQEKLKQEKAKKQKMEARKKAAETKVVRATDTRKKILLGAYMMASMEKNPEYSAKVMTSLGEFLKRDDDRALFGFSPLPVNGN